MNVTFHQASEGSGVAIEVAELQMLSNTNAAAALFAEPDWVGVRAEISESIVQVKAITSRIENGCATLVAKEGTNLSEFPILPPHLIIEVFRTAEVPH